MALEFVSTLERKGLTHHLFLVFLLLGNASKEMAFIVIKVEAGK